MKHSGIQRVGLAAASMVMMLAASCAVRPNPTSEPVAVQPTSLDPIINPTAFGEPEGLEIRWWIVRADDVRVHDALKPYLNQPPVIDEETQLRLRDAGLRVVSVPIADLLSLRRQLPIVGRIDRRWIGHAPRWTEGVGGPRFDSTRTIRSGDEILTLPAGGLRLLVRSWPEVSRAAASMRIDAAIQYIEASVLAGAPPAALRGVARRGVLSEGFVFTSTLAELSCNGVYAQVIIPAPPEFEWDDESDESESDDDESAPTVADIIGPGAEEPAEWTPDIDVDASLVSGPPALQMPTIGEAMLAQPPDPITGRAVHAVLVIVPRVHSAPPLLRQAR